MRKWESLEQELRQIAPEAETDKRYVDKLLKVYLRNGEETWIYIHLEFQGQPDAKLPERMYTYHCLLYIRFRRPILSVAVLGDDRLNWRPKVYEYDLWGCRVSLDYLTVKLWDYRDRVDELRRSGNPFAYFVIAHLKTLETQKDPFRRLAYKEALTRELLDLGLSPNDAQRLFRLIDGLMTLPKELEQEYLHKMYKYQEEKKMPFIAPYEQLALEKEFERGIEKGVEQGIGQGIGQGIEIGSVQEAQTTLFEILNEQFGLSSAALTESIRSITDLSHLRTLRKQVFKAKSLEEVVRLVQEIKKQVIAK